MKKIFSFVTLLVGMVLFYAYYTYTSGQFDYRMAEVLWYLCQWSLTVFSLSLFSLTLNNDKHKRWVLATIIFFSISFFIAYKIGGGSGGILSPSGEMTTWFLAGLYSLISVIYFFVQFFKN